jgi:hypothetical protein
MPAMINNGTGHIGGVIHVLSIVEHSAMDREHHGTLECKSAHGDQLNSNKINIWIVVVQRATGNNRNIKGPLVYHM